MPVDRLELVVGEVEAVEGAEVLLELARPLEAPISADVTRGSRRAQASAIWARLWPRPAAISFSDRTLAERLVVEHGSSDSDLRLAGARALRDPVEVPVR